MLLPKYIAQSHLINTLHPAILKLDQLIKKPSKYTLINNPWIYQDDEDPSFPCLKQPSDLLSSLKKMINNQRFPFLPSSRERVSPDSIKELIELEKVNHRAKLLICNNKIEGNPEAFRIFFEAKNRAYSLARHTAEEFATTPQPSQSQQELFKTLFAISEA